MLGIVGVVFAFLVPIIGIIAVVFGFLGRSREAYARGYWLTGLILGFVTIVVSIVVIALAVVAIAAALNSQN